MSLVFTGVRKM